MRHIVFIVAGERRSVPRRWWEQLEGPRPDSLFSCDGCSASPDVWRGYAIWPACAIHDYHYGSGILGTTWRDRQAADGKLRRNIATLIRLQDGSRARAQSMAWLYWGRVRVWGRRHYEGLTTSRPWWRRAYEAWTGRE